MDSTFSKAIRLLHSNNPDSTYYLGLMLDEAMKSSYGSNPELSKILNHPPSEYPPLLNSSIIYDSVATDTKDESRTGSSSDNELELDLLKEDLMCVICKGMDVAAKNQLLECHECHCLYHQECHEPPIYQEELDSNQVWNCASCKRQIEIKEMTEKLEKNTVYEREIPQRSPVKVKSSKYASGSYASCSTSSSTSRAVSSNINIMNADKRLQIMKKKAAKMQEKRKLNNR